MARAPNEKQIEAEKLFKKGYKLIDISKELDIPEGTIRSWKNRYWGNIEYNKNVSKIENEIIQKEIKEYNKENQELTRENKTLYFKIIKTLTNIINNSNSKDEDKINACDIIVKLSENPQLSKKINKMGRRIDLNNEFSISKDEWEKCIDYFRNKKGQQCCAYCGKNHKYLEKDHVIPLSKGGKATYKNIVPACKQCNTTKNDREFIQWFLASTVYDTERLNKILLYINSKKRGENNG